MRLVLFCVFLDSQQVTLKREHRPWSLLKHSWRQNSLFIPIILKFLHNEKKKKEIWWCFTGILRKDLWLIFKSFHVILDWMDLSATGRLKSLKLLQGINCQVFLLNLLTAKTLEIIDYYYLGLFYSIYALFHVVQQLIQSSKQHNMCNHGPKLSCRTVKWHNNVTEIC